MSEIKELAVGLPRIGDPAPAIEAPTTQGVL